MSIYGFDQCVYGLVMGNSDPDPAGNWWFYINASDPGDPVYENWIYPEKYGWHII